MNRTKRVIAVYLPQYYPVKENDEWWGKGFTEWINVAKAKPLFKGHYQPHIPADLGFYDLRVPETRKSQADLAREYGIYGFCYYHYWFSGKRMLERPFSEVIQSKEPDFPFMLCWANEPWTRSWDGGEKKILIKQEYSEEDDYNHITYLLSVFEDPRYIRIDGKPVFVIYRSTKIPDLRRTVKKWREEASKKGMELYICRFESFSETGEQYMSDIFDASIEFSAHINEKYKKKYIKKILNKISRILTNKNSFLDVVSYPEYVDFVIKQIESDYKCYPCVVPMWDNTARKGRNMFAFINSTPQYYKKWLSHALSRESYSSDENLVFINAWNEWGEGNHLEPCQKWKRRYLEVTKESIDKRATE
jgi:lipopolysaccharide biosynthesis protein